MTLHLADVSNTKSRRLMCILSIILEKKTPLFIFQDVRHGFPAGPTALAWDGELQLLAVATKSGSIRM